MKKSFIISGLLMTLAIMPVFAVNTESVGVDTQVTFSPETQVWNNGSMLDDKIVLTRKVVDGTGSYSQYLYNDGKEAFTLGSNYEILCDGKLIAVHNAELKFYEVKFKEGEFLEAPLDLNEVQNIFPDAKILRISQFKDGKMIVKKPVFEKAKYLLLNDTEEYFHKYSFKPSKVKTTPVAGLIETSKSGKITFSHYNQSTITFPKYTIIIKNVFGTHS